jgi:hypothetical protein
VSNNVNESELPPILFESHICALLGVAPRTLNRAKKARDFPFTELPKVGRKPRWSRDQVLSIISAGGRKPKGGR